MSAATLAFLGVPFVPIKPLFTSGAFLSFLAASGAFLVSALTTTQLSTFLALSFVLFLLEARLFVALLLFCVFRLAPFLFAGFALRL